VTTTKKRTKSGPGGGDQTSAKAKAAYSEKALIDQNEFLKHFRSCGIVSKAAKLAKIERTQVYRWEKDDLHSFADRFFDATEEATDALEEEARHRALTGVEEVVRVNGNVVMIPDENGVMVPMTIRKPSDSLLKYLLGGRRKIFRQTSMEMTGADGSDLLGGFVGAVAAVNKKKNKP